VSKDGLGCSRGAEVITSLSPFVDLFLQGIQRAHKDSNLTILLAISTEESGDKAKYAQAH
jgi:hypothetical protein